MHDQIKYLSLSEKLTACQIAKQLHVSKKLVLKTLKEENSCLRYKFRIEYLGQGHTNSAAPIDGGAIERSSLEMGKEMTGRKKSVCRANFKAIPWLSWPGFFYVCKISKAVKER